MKFVLVYTSVGNKKDAERLATIIVKKRLAACANFFKIGSRYWWKGKLTSDSEYAIIFKTPARNYPRLEHELRLLHSYELPAIIALPIEQGSKKYLAWIADEVALGTRALRHEAAAKKRRLNHKDHKAHKVEKVKNTT